VTGKATEKYIKKKNKTKNNPEIIPTGFPETGNKQLHQKARNIKLVIAHNRSLVTSSHGHKQVCSLELRFNLLQQLVCALLGLSLTFKGRECAHPVHAFVLAGNLEKASALHAESIIAS